MAIEDILREIGLTSKEATLYLELLRLGAQPASSLARLIKMPRSTAQYIADALVKRHLLKRQTRNGITHYSPESPEIIKNMLDAELVVQTKEVEHRKTHIDLLTPYFKKYDKDATGRKPHFEVFEGVSASIRAFEQFIEEVPEKDEIYNYVSPATEDHPDFREGMRTFIQKRMLRHVRVKTITTYCDDAFRLKATDKSSFRTTLIGIEKNPDHIFSEILICKRMIISVSYSSFGLFCTLIHDRDIASMHRAMFELAWEQAKVKDSQIMHTSEAIELMKKYRGTKVY
ncbi:hypothetical protein IPJ72_04385 [Candidatus Peregrinibacteria bacterium]|nr:MAG: hypothetical protein IPJ72_04385 [Candidatus Peregrinibacteria bacterium]